jgi:predicted dinucleotide-binding enzyme
MAHVSIIGTGNMGSALSALATKGGNTVEEFDTSTTDKPLTGELVILAVPHTALDDIVAARGEQLAGKVVVDITNPLNFETFDDLVAPADSSRTAELAAALPSSRVLKAFNTTFATALASGTVGGETTTVLVAGDDADAKALLTGIVTAAGLRAVDAGGLKRARELEAIGLLQITLASANKISWTGGFALVP